MERSKLALIFLLFIATVGGNMIGVKIWFTLADILTELRIHTMYVRGALPTVEERERRCH